MTPATTQSLDALPAAAWRFSLDNGTASRPCILSFSNDEDTKQFLQTIKMTLKVLS
jgi:hypothetical protein